MRRLGFPAARVMLLPYDPQLLEPALERTALHEQDYQQENEVEEQGKVRHNWGSVNDAIKAPNPTTTAVCVKRVFSTV
jgi:hypothetical protein